MNSITLTPKTIRLFWEKVSTKDDFSCWNWNASTDRHGYGHMNIGNRFQLAHRISWEIHFGDIPQGMSVCHKCDNPLCVKPNHLFLGTHLENMMDKTQKGRSPKGEKNAQAKLQEKDVLEIRILLEKGLTHGEIGMIYNVSRKTITNINTGNKWSWLK